MRYWRSLWIVRRTATSTEPAIELFRDTRGVWRAPGDFRAGSAKTGRPCGSTLSHPPPIDRPLWSWMHQSTLIRCIRAGMNFLKHCTGYWKVTWPGTSQHHA